MLVTKHFTGTNRRSAARRKAEYELQADMLKPRQSISIELYKKFQENIRSNKSSTFGLVKLTQLNVNQLPTEFNVYSKNEDTLTLLQYAVKYKRDGIIQALLRAGADPTVSTFYPNGFLDQQVPKYLRSLHKAVSVYVVYLVSSPVSNLKDNITEGSFACSICPESRKELLTILYPCTHSVCHKCYWGHIIATPKYTQHTCAKCSSILCRKSEISVSSNDNSSISNTSPKELAAQTKAKYDTLPTDKDELPPTYKRAKFQAQSVKAMTHFGLGVTKTDRDAEFFMAVDVGNLLRLEALLKAGVDIESHNEFGQTAYFVACWRQHYDIVDLLKRYGSDVEKADPCGIVPQTLLEYKQRAPPSLISPANATVTTLLDPNMSHPGAGSWMLDGFFTDTFLDDLLALWEKLPMAPPCKDMPRNKRTHYCDTQENVSRTLQQAMEFVKNQPNIVASKSPSRAFPHMRFLTYDEEGGFLPPHTDLSKLLPDGTRSTHTFILYLTDCDVGGETVLLDQQFIGKALKFVKPKRGRLFVFPHVAPHEARATVTCPKILLRGESQ